jgi:hypothetical protein
MLRRSAGLARRSAAVLIALVRRLLLCHIAPPATRSAWHMLANMMNTMIMMTAQLLL